jgi:hypothetical protein
MRRTLVVVMLTTSLFAQSDADKPVEQSAKNIKVLMGMPRSQLIPSMAFIANSLGVTCSHCHTAAWESDEKPAKETARRMLKMTRLINEQNFDGKLTVTCNSCHRGRLRPEATPIVADAGWNRLTKIEPPKLPPAAEILARYRSALGSEKAIAAQTKRVARGTVTRWNGRVDPVSAPFTLTQELPQKAELQTELSYPPEAGREVVGQFFRIAKGLDPTITATTTGKADVRGQETYVVDVKGERWYFDLKTGLLLRRHRETPTPLGVLPEEFDFDDYRNVDGVQVPFFMQWSRADYQVTHRFTEVTGYE